MQEFFRMMILQKSIRKIIISIIVLLILDGIFIFLTKKMFSDQIINVQRVIMQLRPLGAVVCYILLIGVLQYFIISKNRSPLEAFILGFAIYGVYESTNYATLKKWTGELAILDTFWGGSLFGLTTYFTYLLA